MRQLLYKFLNFFTSSKKKKKESPLPEPLNPGVNFQAFEWQCEKSSLSVIGRGEEDEVVFLTVTYKGSRR
jgi:hypothetical protein